MCIFVHTARCLCVFFAANWRKFLIFVWNAIFRAKPELIWSDWPGFHCSCVYPNLVRKKLRWGSSTFISGSAWIKVCDKCCWLIFAPILWGYPCFLCYLPHTFQLPGNVFISPESRIGTMFKVHQEVKVYHLRKPIKDIKCIVPEVWDLFFTKYVENAREIRKSSTNSYLVCFYCG